MADPSAGIPSGSTTPENTGHVVVFTEVVHLIGQLQVKGQLVVYIVTGPLYQYS